jgi:PAS domain S-box-containing protein
LGSLGNHAVVLLDTEGTIIAWFAGAERLFGYKPEEIIGQHSGLLFTPEDRSKELHMWEIKTASEAGESEDDRWQVRKDGGRIWTSGTLTALREESGELLGFVKVMRNRTDQKSQLETLESRVSALQSLEKQKNAFIATLAHELRNPLSTLTNAAQLLQQYESTSHEVALTAGMIARQADFMGRMVDDLLEVTRAATGKITLQKKKVILQDLIDEALESCRGTVDGHTYNIQRLLPDVSVWIEVDPTRLRQVFVNLLENAAKYTQAGGTIWIKATVEGDEAVIRIQDTGLGIPPEVMPHIFELFTQADSAHRSQRGLGIGLSVVKENVALHGGSVQAASDGLGKGSEFTVRLPVLSLLDE